jgi:hypothetical protein
MMADFPTSQAGFSPEIDFPVAPGGGALSYPKEKLQKSSTFPSVFLRKSYGNP